ncbi:MAG: uracil phosphoribosyltransferase [Bacteroidetes bacterium]|nr:uracil phosphoribosyltransferase [Bacteroidota bacterium]
MVHILSNSTSILNVFISEIRDAEIQKDRLRFRVNLERLGEIFAYEISRQMTYKEKEVFTPLGSAMVPVLSEEPVLAVVLRAGLPFHQGFLNFFDHADSAFISAYRKMHKDGSFTINVEYSQVPDINDKVLIICDAMLASGTSMVNTYRDLMLKGKPKHVHLVSVLASEEGLDYIRKHVPQQDLDIWVGVIDEELTAQSLIVPGLGDAGDLAYGRKELNT